MVTQHLLSGLASHTGTMFNKASTLIKNALIDPVTFDLSTTKPQQQLYTWLILFVDMLPYRRKNGWKA